MRYSYRPSGVCSSLIQFDLNSGVISNVSFTGGCNGNLKALSKAIDGMTGEKVVELFRGIECGRKKDVMFGSTVKSSERGACKGGGEFCRPAPDTGRFET